MASTEIRARLALLIDADADTTFDAWLVPAVMERWLFKSPSNRLVAKTNPVSGGSYSIIEYDAGSVITHDGVYSTVDRPRRLAFSLLVPQHFAGAAQIEVTIVPEGSKSRLEFLARGAGPDDAQKIWEKMLANLEAVIKRDRTDDRAKVATDNLAGLEILVGKWITHIKMIGGDQDGVEYRAEDVYRWMTGNRFLLHDVHAVMNNGEMTGLEIISPCDTPGEFAARSYDSTGSIVDARMTFVDGAWESVSLTQRFKGRIAQDGKSAHGQWERLQSDRWEPWMHIELRKTSRS